MNIAHINYKNDLSKSDPYLWISEYRFFYEIWRHIALENKVSFYEFIDCSQELNHEGIDFFFFRKGQFQLLFPFFINWKIARENFDVVVVHSLQFPLQLIFLKMVLDKATKIVVQHHAEQVYHHPIRRIIQKIANRFTSAYFFSGNGLAQKWINEGLISEYKLKEIMEVTSLFTPIDRDAARIITGIKGSYNYIWVGHLNNNKNPLLAVRAFSALLHKGVEANLYLIFQSKALLEDIKDFLQKDPIASAHIHLVGKIPNDQLVHWYSSVEFIISTSKYEGSGVAVCEAMSCGCIPILSNIPSFQFMTDNHCGILFEEGDEKSLFSALESSLQFNIPLERELTIQHFKRALSGSAIAQAVAGVLSSL